jgi:uncharacterized protein YyaL (SSP411 family)
MNRLATEQSPYLLQHAANPVEWYPWGDEAFARARADDKPIFLSIGYSTCHWCHVMEHESFESGEIATILNTHFVSIKVDREERPDVDRVYMTFVQATTGSGGWPMSVWLTPALEPFYGGTYYPPIAQWGRPGFREVLLEIARAWREERAGVLQSARQMTERLTDMAANAGGSAAAVMSGAEALASTVRQFEHTFDRRRGGFGDAPKFPRPSELLFLLREHARTGAEAPRDMVLSTLRAMALGGMRDHIGGGFHRYSVDGDWRVPHFEKMLYDQAQLVLAYLEGAQVSGDAFYGQIAEDTLQYVARDLSDPEGGFYSAEDADSVPPASAKASAGEPASGETTTPTPKSEGAFYIWTLDEIRETLGDDSRAFERRYGVLPDGNAPFDPQNEFTGRNLLYTARGIGEIAQQLDDEPQRVAEALERGRVRLFERRASRPRPHLDDKVLTAWNGLMIGAFARAARVTGDVRYDAPARRAAAFFRRTMWDSGRRVLLRRYRQGHAAIDGYAEDYAYLIFGVLELFAVRGEAEWLEWAIALQRRQDELFWDGSSGGWFSTTGQDPTVLMRMKEDYDGAEPSPSAVGAWNLLTLAHLTSDSEYRSKADHVFRAFGTRLLAHGRTLPMMAAALSMSLAPPEQIVVVGSDSDDTDTLWRAANRRYRPFAQVFRVEPGVTQQTLGTLLPWTASMVTQHGKPAAYVCRNFTCDTPATDPEKIA